MIGTLWVGLGTALSRNLFGWAKNSLEDEKIQDYEWKKLAISSTVAVIVYFGAYYGINELSANAEWISAGVTLLVSPIIDTLIKKWQEKKAARLIAKASVGVAKKK